MNDICSTTTIPRVAQQWQEKNLLTGFLLLFFSIQLKKKNQFCKGNLKRIIPEHQDKACEYTVAYWQVNSSS